MKLPLNIVLLVLGIVLAAYAYFSVAGQPLDAADMVVVAIFALGFVLLVRWAWTRSRPKRGQE